MNVIGGTGDWNPVLNFSRAPSESHATPRSDEVRGVAPTGIQRGEKSESVSESKRISHVDGQEMIDRSIRVSRDTDTGKILFRFKNSSGEDVQIPGEESIRSSKRIRDYLERIEKDVLFGSGERRVDLFV